MTDSTSPLAAALVAFQKVLPTVTKDKTAKVPTKSGGEYSYTYADLASVSAAAIPLLTKHGLAFTSAPRMVEGGAYELVGILRHESGETVEGALPLFGRTPQELGSAMTYARRYLLGCMTGVVTEDDDDGARAQHAQGRTRRGPTAEEIAAERLEQARLATFDAYRRVNPDAKREDLVTAFEQETALPFLSASADDLHAYAATLEGVQP